MNSYRKHPLLARSGFDFKRKKPRMLYIQNPVIRSCYGPIKNHLYAFLFYFPIVKKEIGKHVSFSTSHWQVCNMVWIRIYGGWIVNMNVEWYNFTSRRINYYLRDFTVNLQIELSFSLSRPSHSRFRCLTHRYLFLFHFLHKIDTS